MILHSVCDKSEDEYGSLVNDTNRDLNTHKHVPLSLCPRQITHVVSWDRNRVAASRVRWGAPRAIARLELIIRQC